MPVIKVECSRERRSRQREPKPKPLRSFLLSAPYCLLPTAYCLLFFQRAIPNVTDCCVVFFFFGSVIEMRNSKMPGSIPT